MQSRDYLSYTKRERTAILALIVIMLILGLAPGPVFERNLALDDASLQQLKRMAVRQESMQIQESYPAAKDTANRYMSRYRTKEPSPAGSFRQQRPDQSHPRANYFRAQPVKVRRRPQVVEINSADTAAFIALPGIGSTLAARIVLFREKLGGFHSIKQVGEVYGLQDSVFSRILPLLRCDPCSVKKIAINTAEKETLRQHPYIRWEIANAVVAYRDQHGLFRSVGDLNNIASINTDALQKMMPYLSLN